MTNEIQKLYHAAREDRVFLQAIKDADNDSKPNIFASPEEKHLFVSVYYGWLVALGKFNKKDFEL